MLDRTINKIRVTAIMKKAIDEAYEEGCINGKSEYYKECTELYNDNPSMGFTTEQVMWIKERMRLSKEDGVRYAINKFTKIIMEQGLTDGCVDAESFLELAERVKDGLI